MHTKSTKKCGQLGFFSDEVGLGKTLELGTLIAYDKKN